MNLTLRYAYHKVLSIEKSAGIADEHVGPLRIQWVGVASTRFASHAGFLYFVYDQAEIPAPATDPASVFGCVVTESLSDKCRGIPRIIVPDDCDMDVLFDFVVNEIERYRNWHDLMNDLLVSDASYLELVQATARFVPRPMYVADACWRMMDHVDYEMGEISATWHYQLLHDGLYPLHIVDELNRTGEYQYITNLPHAKLIKDSQVFKIPIIAKPIKHRGKLVGYYFMIDTWGDLGYCEEEIAEEFGKLLAPLMDTRGEQQGYMAGLRNNFMTQIIEGFVTDRRDIARQLKAETHWSMESEFRMATVRFTPNEFDNHLLHMRVLGMLGSEFDAHAFFYRDTIIVLFRNPHSEKVDLMEHLEHSCSILKRTIVISKRFRHFEELPTYYRQNVFMHNRIDESGEVEPRVVSCESSFALLLADCCKDALPYCYEVDMLAAYDRSTGKNYCETLYSYLKNERNAVATANELFLHRNTLRNRLQKIHDATRADLDDPDVRLRLLISLNTLLNAS